MSAMIGGRWFLGALAGGTIFLGLPIARLRTVSVKTKAFLNAVSTGVLIFLLVEMGGHLLEGIEELVEQAVEQRRPPLAEAHRVLGADRQGARVTPHRAARGVDVAAPQPGARREVQVVAVVGAPARLGQRIGPAGRGIDVVHGARRQRAASSAVRARTLKTRPHKALTSLTPYRP